MKRVKVVPTGAVKRRTQPQTVDGRSGVAEVREDSRAAGAPARSGPRTGPKSVKVVALNNPDGAKRGRRAFVENAVIVNVRMPAVTVQLMDDVIEKGGFVYRDRSEFLRQAALKMLNDPELVQHLQRVQRRAVGRKTTVAPADWSPAGRLTRLQSLAPKPTDKRD